MKLILGSGSPRRRELLAQIGVEADDIRPPDIDEDPRPGELPRPYCVRLAREKALAIPSGGRPMRPRRRSFCTRCPGGVIVLSRPWL
jgi:predicted house-cleaning NTP pyrophosphatase (Maf/HAM1 superfamily)